MKSFEIPCLDYSLAADWYKGASDEVLLSLIGYTSNRGRYNDLLSEIVERTGSSALVFDYSGHGESPFELRNVTPAQNFLETVTVFDWINSKYPNKKINVMGSSYGGFFGAMLTYFRTFSKLALRVPAIYRPEDFYSPWSIRIENEEEYSRKLNAYRTDINKLKEHPLFTWPAKFTGKTLVVVHEKDEMVPKETTDAFINVFRAGSYLAKGFEHSAPLEDSKDGGAYKKAIIDWLLR